MQEQCMVCGEQPALMSVDDDLAFCSKQCMSEQLQSREDEIRAAEQLMGLR